MLRNKERDIREGKEEDGEWIGKKKGRERDRDKLRE